MTDTEYNILLYIALLLSPSTGLQQTVERQLFNFRRYDFLWKDDMHALYQVFVDNDPGTTMFKLEVERLQNIEHDVLEIPGQLMVGSVCLNTSPIKDSLHGFAVAWKMRYSTQLHEEAKVCYKVIVIFVWRCGGLMVSALDSGSSGPVSSPGRGHCVVFLGKILY